jgi:hypothetical protein
MFIGVGRIAKRHAGNGEVRDVSIINRIQIVRAPPTINHEELLLRNFSDTGDGSPRICAVKCSRYSPEGNPRRTGKSWDGHHHISKIQWARAKPSFEVVRSRARYEGAASVREAGLSGDLYLVLPLVLECP